MTFSLFRDIRPGQPSEILESNRFVSECLGRLEARVHQGCRAETLLRHLERKLGVYLGRQEIREAATVARLLQWHDYADELYAARMASLVTEGRLASAFFLAREAEITAFACKEYIRAARFAREGHRIWNVYESREI